MRRPIFLQTRAGRPRPYIGSVARSILRRVSTARIQQLSPALVNRIAAGEVIERPAAVVKELVENALDAGATQIQIDVEEGGRELIRVTDNGSEESNTDDLTLAFASHATSKLTSDDDLFRIGTMGFRGEALASIGSVSHSRILSRTPARDAAYEVLNRGGDDQRPPGGGGQRRHRGRSATTCSTTLPPAESSSADRQPNTGTFRTRSFDWRLPFPGCFLSTDPQQSADAGSAGNHAGTADAGRVAGRLPAASRLPDRTPPTPRSSVHGIVGLPELARPDRQVSVPVSQRPIHPGQVGPARRARSVPRV